VDDKGRRCSERKGLHFDHVVPHARGGASTADNLRLRCGPHNQLAAEQAFGPLFMQSRAGRRKLPGEGPALSGRGQRSSRRQCQRKWPKPQFPLESQSATCKSSLRLPRTTRLYP
jgi:hypothetical protein